MASLRAIVLFASVLGVAADASLAGRGSRAAGTPVSPAQTGLLAWWMGTGGRGSESIGGQKLVPGIVESSKEALDWVTRQLGVNAMPITKEHMGYWHVCQPWEDCAGLREEAEEEAQKKNPRKVTVEEDGQLFLPPRKCENWGATVTGCECIDSCECDRKQGKCQTRGVLSEADGVESTCGFQESDMKWYDQCSLVTTPPPPPELKLRDPTFEHKQDPDIWRNFNAHKNKRYLPKKACFSRDYYCATFPRFPGCEPTKTYRPLRKNYLTEEQQAQIADCKAHEEQGKCEAATSCGKGQEGTCYPNCIWTEDAPMWFRTMRGRQNHKIKRSGKDPAMVHNAQQLPVLQPGPGIGNNLVDQDRAKMTITPAPPAPAPPEETKAGDVGTQRSKGFDRPDKVGQNVGSDMAPIGGFRPSSIMGVGHLAR